MAYDKIVDSSALNADLTGIANAIRSKGGTSASLAFPAGFINAISQMETGKVTTEVHDLTVASDFGNGTNTIKTILSGNAFIKDNYTKNSFAVVLIPVNPIPMTGAGYIHFIYHGNANIGASDAVRTGVTFRSSSATSLANGVATSKISANGYAYNASFRAYNTGNLEIYIANNLILKAGTYKLILLCWGD